MQRLNAMNDMKRKAVYVHCRSLIAVFALTYFTLFNLDPVFGISFQLVACSSFASLCVPPRSSAFFAVALP
jgi:hypothetical protein